MSHFNPGLILAGKTIVYPSGARSLR